MFTRLASTEGGASKLTQCRRAGCRMRDARYRSRIQDAGYRIQDARYRIQDVYPPTERAGGQGAGKINSNTRYLKFETGKDRNGKTVNRRKGETEK